MGGIVCADSAGSRSQGPCASEPTMKLAVTTLLALPVFAALLFAADEDKDDKGKDAPKKPTAETVTVREIQEHVRKYLADTTRQDEVAEFRKVVILDPAGLSYRKSGDRYVLRWEVVPRSRVTLSEEEKVRLER